MSALLVLLWLALSVLPGLAIVRLVRLPGPLGMQVVVAVPVTIGAAYLAASVADRFGAPVIDTDFAVLGAVVAGWLAVEVVRARSAAERRPPLTEWLAGWRALDVAGARVLLLAAVGLGLFLWRDLHTDLSTPAGWDAMHLGFMTRQIVAHETISSAVTQSSGPFLHDGSSFYPIGIPLLTAMLAVATGVKISTLMLASTVAYAGVVLPAGTYYVTRRLLPSHPVVAGMAAIAGTVPAVLSTLEYPGRTTAIIGLALVPATVLALAWAGERVCPWHIAVAPLAMIGLTVTHTSEVALIAGLVPLIVVVRAVQTRRWRPVLRWLGWTVGAAVVASALLVIVDPSIRNAASARTAAYASPHGETWALSHALRELLFLDVGWPGAETAMHAWTATALAGSVLTLLHRRYRALAAFAVGYLVYGAFWVLWLTGKLGPLVVLGDPWYRNTGRIAWELAVLGAIPVAVALATVASVVPLVAGWLRAGRRVRLALAGLSVAGVLAAFTAVAAPATAAESGWLRSSVAPVDAHARGAFRYLAAHLAPGDQVLDDLEGRGETWMYTDYGVPTVFGNPPLIGGAPTSWKERLYLRGELRNIAKDGCVEYLMRRFRVSYVYYSDQHMWAAPLQIRLPALLQPQYFRQVYRSGDVRIFAVVPQPGPVTCRGPISTKYPWSTLQNAH